MEDIEAYGKSKQEWLSKYLKLPGGTPCHDTFNRFFSALDSHSFESCFLDWIKSVAQLIRGEIMPIDGKTMRASGLKGAKSAIHMVSAWANTNHLALGQVKTSEKSNDITAIPQLLKSIGTERLYCDY